MRLINLLVLLFATSFVVAMPAYAQDHPEKPSPRSETTSTSPPKLPEPDWNNINCSNPKNHDEADLCEQRRMATAAEQTVVLNTIQVVLGVAGTLALLATIYYTRKSTSAAATAARAAEAAVIVASENAQRELRAYVGAHNLEVTNFLAGKSPHFKYNPENTGQTPAHHLSIRCAVFIFDHPEEGKVHIPKTHLSRISLGSGQEVSQDFVGGPALTNELHRACMDGKVFFVLAGAMTYRDIFKKRHQTTFRAYVNPALLVAGAGKLSSTRKHNNAS